MNGKSVKYEKFTVRLLKKDDVSSMFFLAKEIYNNLGEKEQTFIRKHENPSYFKNAVQDPSMAFIGVFHQNRLVAMSYIKVCKNRDVFNSEIPHQSTTAFENNRSVATFGGDCVLPAYRGNKFNQCMVAIRLKMAEKQNCMEVYSIIDRNNINNLPPYFTNNFKLISASIDPSDNGPIYTMRSNLKEKKHIQTVGIVTTFVHATNKKMIDKLLIQNMQGIDFNPATGIIKFIPTTQLIQTRKPILKPAYMRGELNYV